MLQAFILLAMFPLNFNFLYLCSPYNYCTCIPVRDLKERVMDNDWKNACLWVESPTPNGNNYIKVCENYISVCESFEAQSL